MYYTDIMSASRAEERGLIPCIPIGAVVGTCLTPGVWSTLISIEIRAAPCTPIV